MMALLVAVLTASSAVAALWPLVHTSKPASFQVVVEDWSQRPDSGVVRRRQGCRRIPIVVRKPGEVQKGCSSARQRPCSPRRRW